MAENATIRLNKVLRELNISLDRAVDFLSSKGHEIEARPTTKISEEVHQVLLDEFQTDMSKKVASKEVGEEKRKEKEAIRIQLEQEQEDRRAAREKRAAASEVIKAKAELSGPKTIGKIDLDAKKKPAAKAKEEVAVEAPKEAEKAVTSEAPKAKVAEADKPKTTEAKEEPVEDVKLATQYKKLSGPKITGDKIDLAKFKKPEKKKDEVKKTENTDRKKKRRRIISNKPGNNAGRGSGTAGGGGRKGGQRYGAPKVEPSEEDVQKQVRETLEKLQGKSKKGKGAKRRRDKRDQHRLQAEANIELEAIESKTLKVTEFVTANDEIEENIVEEVDAPEDLKPRAPIVTVMGHVDHGKTSLLDHIREENVIAGESGGITQHIGAYGVTLEDGQKIAFLDTPGHEAFTAMRARGAQVTDIAIIVIAADDDIMPQTKEAISHAQAAGVPIVFAINKIDRPTANPDKIKEGLSNMNLLVEDWGGKIQSHDISAKTGDGVNELLEKVLLEAELLELKANPDKLASGTVVEAYLDKGKGYISTILVQAGTLKIGDFVLAGTCSGKVKAMHDERGNIIKEAGPSQPISILGLDGAPQAGDKFNVLTDEREAKQIATRRSQLQREQSVRTQRHITLDEIGRRIALGDFKELNIILKGDVDGSVEALTDSFQKLSTDEIQVNIIHKAVGPITESDVLLASASDAVIIGFNVRPMGNARQVAEKEEIDIRMYSIIYDAINDLKDAMEGMLSPEMKEEITGTAEIRETFKISKIGTIAGCMVTTGKIFRKSGIRLIRDGVVIYTGELDSLKRFKDDVKEVAKGYDCGLQIKNYNDIKELDIVECFQEVAVAKKLKSK